MGDGGQHRSSVYQEKAEAVDFDRRSAIDSFQSAMNGYQQAINGNTPSVAQQQMKQGMDQAIQSQMAMAASQRGRNPAAAQRQVMNNTASIQQQTNSNAAVLRAQEIEAARAGMGQMSLNRIGQTDSNWNQKAQIGAQIGQAADPTTKIFGGISGAAQGTAAVAAMSDENSKTDVKDGTSAVHDFLEHLSTSKYQYKSGKKDAPGAGKGEFVSPMAQEMEQSSIGSNMVMDTPNGKMVDYGKGFGAMLAALADQHERLKRIEGGGKAQGEKKDA